MVYTSLREPMDKLDGKFQFLYLYIIEDYR